ncbi:TPA: hypothetical protein QI007_003649 [Klebsiella pneumoniae subsp. pneumoniae]|nr:hypothetical protein [Klebsiella pneumoniae]HDU3818635.1 hypothetical protein [Klebsiella pneumoniae subsp. pneumoniae]
MTKQKYLSERRAKYNEFKKELYDVLKNEADSMNLTFFDCCDGYLTEKKKRYMTLCNIMGKLLNS